MAHFFIAIDLNLSINSVFFTVSNYERSTECNRKFVYAYYFHYITAEYETSQSLDLPKSLNIAENVISESHQLNNYLSMFRNHFQAGDMSAKRAQK